MQDVTLITVDRPALIGQQDVIRLGDAAYTAIPRRSGKIRLYPYQQTRKGMPWSLPVAEWVIERKRELEASLFGSFDW